MTECITETVSLEVDQPAEVLRALEITEFEQHHVYQLTASDIQTLREQFGLKLDPALELVKIRHGDLADDLPYQVHTNRELALMLAGKKPLSTFAGSWPPSTDVEEIPERLFDPHVAAGRFAKVEYLDSSARDPDKLIRRVLYATLEETWRIKAHILLWKTARQTGWNEGFERMEGSLLGYTDEQNDAYMDFARRGSGQHLQ